MSPLAFVLLPLVLTAITLVAVGRALGRVADEADQLRAALVRVDEVRPMVVAIGTGARSLGAGIARLGR